MQYHVQDIPPTPTPIKGCLLETKVDNIVTHFLSEEHPYTVIGR